MSEDYVSISKYADMRGLDKSVISRQVNSGQIPHILVNGKKRIDPAAADLARAQNVDASKSRKPVSGTLSAVASAAPVQAPDVAYPAIQPALPLALADQAGPGYNDERTRLVKIQADQAALRLAETQRELVRAQEVRDASEEAFRLLRNRIVDADDCVDQIRSAETPKAARLVYRSLMKGMLEKLAIEFSEISAFANSDGFIESFEGGDAPC